MTTRAEDCENYKGNKPIDELINFIGGQNDSNRKTKKLPAAASEDIPSKTQKSNKKNKDKKQKSSTVSGANSVKDGSGVKGGNSAQTVTGVVEGGSRNNMGNSSAKDDCVENPVENGDIDGFVKEKDELDVLKENNKKMDVKKGNLGLTENCVDSVQTINIKEIYKEKETASTNNKRDAVNASHAAENNKKKSEKSGKASKADKSEMSVSKSDDTMKVDTAAANNTVKQKNAKNKKSKPVSPTVKMERDSVVEELMNPQVLGDFPSIDNNFIFTDLDVPQVPKEDEFTIVGKKKKKVAASAKDAQPHHNNFLTGGNGGKSRRYEEKRGGNSVSHAPKANVHASQQPSSVESEAHMRDLSPSAFPALGSGKGKQEGRRNSTGDVPIPTGLKTQDDSDLESVKSLPATQGSQAADSALSPRLSYARITAPLGSSKHRNSGDSGVNSTLDVESEIDPKKAVWKGSPTERRHSIGSSPEVVNKNAGSNITSAAASLKAGSQEHIVADAALKAADNSGASVRKLNAWGKSNNQETSRKPEPQIVLDKENSPSEIRNDAKVSNASSVQSAVPLGVDIDSSFGSVSQSQLISASKAPPTSKPVESVHTETEIPNSSSSNRNLSTASSSVHKQDATKHSKTSNGSNGKKQKSVIFLDKRVEETPGNLGISFGFEIDSLDKTVLTDQTLATPSGQSVDTIEFCSEPAVVHSAENSCVNEAYSEVKDVVSIDQSSLSHNSSSSSVISNSPEISHDNKLSSATADANSNTVKKTQLVRLNGIVPRTQGESVNLTSETQDSAKVTDTVSSPAEQTAAITSPDAFEAPEDNIEGECIYYGEYVESVKKNIVVPSQTNGPTQYCGMVRYLEKPEVKNNFNIMEAALFLSRGKY